MSTNRSDTPRPPARPLVWPDIILELQEILSESDTSAYLVGGPVRDALLGRPIKDVDLATPGNGIKLARQIANTLKGDFFPLDAERDVGRALVDTPDGRLIFDVARFRALTLAEDLADRDFTTNAMAVDARGDLALLIDPLGGEQDTYSKLLRRCGPNSIPHDPIRALRAVRQSVQLGFGIERETRQDIRAIAPRLNDVSPERVRDELFKILTLGDPARALRVADALGLLKVVMPELVPLVGLTLPAPHVFNGWDTTLIAVDWMTGILATISPRRTDATAAQFSLGMIVMALDPLRQDLIAHIERPWPDGRSHRALLMLAALLHRAGTTPDESAKTAEQVAARFHLSNAERQRLAAAARFYRRCLELPDTEPLTIYRLWRETGEAGIDACLLALAVYLATYGPTLKQDAWLIQLEHVKALLNGWFRQRDQLIDPPVLLDGNALQKALGIKRGPKIGQVLESIREAQVMGQVSTPDDALAYAKRVLGDS